MQGKHTAANNLRVQGHLIFFLVKQILKIILNYGERWLKFFYRKPIYPHNFKEKP